MTLRFPLRFAAPVLALMLAPAWLVAQAPAPTPAPAPAGTIAGKWTLTSEVANGPSTLEIKLDGTKNKAKLGANALLAVSLATAKAAAAKRVWIDVDCDVFDPAFFPAVPLPLPFGLTPPLFLRMLEAVWSEKVCGLSVSEFDPGRDVRDTSLNLLGWLLEHVLLRRYGG